MSGKLSAAMSARLWSCLRNCSHLTELKLDDLSMIVVREPLSVLPSVRTLESNSMQCDQIIPILKSLPKVQNVRLGVGNNDSHEFMSNVTSALSQMDGDLRSLEVGSVSRGVSTGRFSRNICVEFSQVIKNSLPHLEEVHFQTLDIDDSGLCEIVTSFRHQGSFKEFR